MIDPCIYKVYKQDKKVFLPDFGAIIYSEVSDSIDFNDLLTFDDGKVIEEIQSRQKTSEKEAKKALEEHIDKIKAKLDDGNSHLIRGLGYLYKDEQGAYAMQKKKPVLKDPKETKPEEAQPAEDIIPPMQVESTDAENNETEEANPVIDLPQEEEITSAEIEPDLIIGQEPEEEEVADIREDSKILLDNEEQSYSYKPLLSEEDENVQEYLKRKEEYDHKDKKPRPLFSIIAAVVIILIIASAVLYYFQFYSSDQTVSENISTATKDAIDPELTQDVKGSETIAATEYKSNDEKAQESIPAATTIVEEENNSIEADKEVISSDNGFQTTENNKVYSLILGSFKVESNANNFQAHLTGQGIEASIFRRGGSFHFVGYEQITGKPNAVKLLTEMREEEPSAWIIRNRQF